MALLSAHAAAALCVVSEVGVPADSEPASVLRPELHAERVRAVSLLRREAGRNASGFRRCTLPPRLGVYSTGVARVAGWQGQRRRVVSSDYL
jgi:hypothetical protein